MKTRILACLLAAVMLLGATACGVGEKDKTDDEAKGTSASNGSESEGEEVYVPDIEKKNYEMEFNIATVHDKEMVIVEQTSGDTLLDSVYERAVNIKEHVGVDLVILDAGDWIQMPNNIITSVLSGDDTYQLGMTHVYQGLTDMVTANALYDYGELESVNLQAPYWATELMEEIRIEDKYLMGHSDFFLTDVHCIVFNKDLMQEHGMEEPYEMVRNKEWTLDKFIEMSSLVSADNGDGTWDNQDTYGLAGWGWVYLIDFVTSSDMKIVEKDENDNFVIAYNNHTEKMTELVDTIFDLYNADYTYFWKSTEQGNADAMVDFAKGNALFSFYNTSTLKNFRGEEIRFGILPYPMYDADQENYKTLNWSGMMVIPSVIEHPDMVSDVVELLGYYTAPVKTAYYEELLGAKLANAPEDAEMLELLWDTVVSDIGIVACAAERTMDNLTYLIPKICESGKNNYASYVKGNSRGAQRALDRVFGQEV